MIEEAARPQDKTIVLGLATGLGALAAVIANPISGHLSDRYANRANRRVFVLVGMVSGALFLFVLGVQTSIVGITVLWVLCQVTLNIAYASLAASVVDHVLPNRWATVWGYIGMAQSLGLVAGFVLVSVLFTSVRGGLLTITCIYAATLTPFILVIGPLPRIVSRPSPGRNGRFLMVLSHDRGFRIVWAGRFLVVLANATALLYLYYYLQDVIHYSKPGEGQLILVAISTAATAVTAVLFGRHADKSGNYRLQVIVATVAMAIAGFALAIISTWSMALAVAVILGTGYGVFASAGQALSTTVLPDGRTVARDLGIINVANTIPQVIGPPIAVLLIYLGAGYRGIFIFAASMALFAAVIISRLDKPITLS